MKKHPETRVLFVVNSLSILGGMEIVTLHKLNALAAKEHLRIGCAYTDRGDFPQEQIVLSPKVETFDLEIHTWQICGSLFRMAREYLKRMYKFRKTLRKLIKSWKPDIVVSVGSYEKIVIASLSRHVGEQRFKTVREFHFASNYRSFAENTNRGGVISRFMNWIDQRILPKCYDINCLLTQGDLDDNFPKHPKRIKVIPNPITSGFPSINPRQTDRNNTVLFVGRLTFQKNPDELIDIWQCINHDGWKLRIIGTGPLEQKCKEQARDKALDDSIEFAGWSNDVGAELRKAKIFVATSRYEGFPLALIEAAANGTVPVSYNTPYGPGDMISQNQDGILVPYGDRDTFIRELKTLMEDSSRLQQMSDAAFKKARQYDISVIADRWEDVYESLLKHDRH